MPKAIITLDRKRSRSHVLGSRRVFHLSLRLVIFAGLSARLAYLVDKSGGKTATFKHFVVPCTLSLRLISQGNSEPLKYADKYKHLKVIMTNNNYDGCIEE